MKRVAAAAILMTVMLSCCAASLFWLRFSILQLEKELTTAEALAGQGEYAQAILQLSESTQRWEKREHIFSRLLRHKELETITTILVSLPAYLEYRDLSNFYSAVSQSKQLLRHIWEAELPVLSNLL